MLLLAIFAFYWWTANTSYFPPQTGRSVEDRYNALTDGFLHGRLSLPTKPSSGLLALENPYDPVANLPYRRMAYGGSSGGFFQDVSLYNGRFYLYFGPTPVVTLFAPLRVLGVGRISESLAVLVYSCAGLLFAVLFLRFLVRHYVPETPSWAKLLATLAVAAGGALPFLLRRPTTYEVAISAAFAFLFAAFYLLATGTLGARLSLWRMAVGSLCLGLSVGARADLALAIAVPLALWAWLAHTSRLGNDWSKVKTALALVGPVLLCGVLVLVYNKLRFESFTEFGQRYALTGRIQPPSYKLEYLAPGLYFLLVAPARLTFAFPFFHLPPPPNYPGKLPTSGYTVELAGGLLSNVPLTLGGLALPLLRHRGTLAKEAAYLTGALLALGLLTAALISFANTGFVTMRYEVDFATIVVVGALMCWFATLQAARVSRRAYSLASAALVVFALWGILYGVAISFDYYDQFRQLHPQTYDSLARFFRPVPTLLFILGFICAAWLLVGGRDDGEADAGLTDDVS